MGCGSDEGYPSGVTTRRYVIGRPLARTIVYEPLPTVLAPQLRPAPAGYQYAVVDGDVVLINTASRVIADAIAHIFD